VTSGPSTLRGSRHRTPNSVREEGKNQGFFSLPWDLPHPQTQRPL
jgi:hypothetical protein